MCTTKARKGGAGVGGECNCFFLLNWFPKSAQSQGRACQGLTPGELTPLGVQVRRSHAVGARPRVLRLCLGTWLRALLCNESRGLCAPS